MRSARLIASSISARGDCESHDVKMTDKVAKQYGAGPYRQEMRWEGVFFCKKWKMGGVL